jgi:hypothetical protein
VRVKLFSLSRKWWCGRTPREPAARADTTAEPGTSVAAPAAVVTAPATPAEAAEATEAEAMTTEGMCLVGCH